MRTTSIAGVLTLAFASSDWQNVDARCSVLPDSNGYAVIPNGTTAYCANTVVLISKTVLQIFRGAIEYRFVS